MSRSLLASVGTLDSLDDGTGDLGEGGRYASFDDGDGSFLAALRQTRRKSIRQVRRA